MIKTITCVIIVILLGGTANNTMAQVAINTTGDLPDNSAILDVKSSNKGMLVPRMTTTQRMSIPNPADGLLVYDTDKKMMSSFSSSNGWNLLDAAVPGRVYISESYPDGLYPPADYDYLGTSITAAFTKNFGFYAGSWVNKEPGLGQEVPLASYRILLYTGSTSNKVLGIGSNIGQGCDSCIAVYNIAADSIYKETVGYIARGAEFTATIDTSNSRIFIWGGAGYNGQTWNIYHNKGFIYNYNTGVKTVIDSATGPSMRRDGSSAIWAKSINRLLVWGGMIGTVYQPAVLYSYDPGANGWTTLATCPLSPRAHQLAAYDGNDHVMIWGGDNPSYQANGAVYTISTNTWALMSTVNAPTAKMYAASWTGSRFIFSNQTSINGGYAYLAYTYDVATDTWTKIPDVPMLDGYYSYMGSPHVWNGSELLQPASLIGVTRNILWSYSPATNNWTALNGTGILGNRTIQAGNTTLINGGTYTSGFQRYISTGFTPSYGTVAKNWYYYKKK